MNLVGVSPFSRAVRFEDQILDLGHIGKELHFGVPIQMLDQHVSHLLDEKQPQMLRSSDLHSSALFNTSMLFQLYAYVRFFLNAEMERKEGNKRVGFAFLSLLHIK